MTMAAIVDAGSKLTLPDNALAAVPETDEKTPETEGAEGP